MMRVRQQNQLSAKPGKLLLGGTLVLLAVYVILSLLVWQNYTSRAVLQMNRLTDEITVASEVEDIHARATSSQKLHDTQRDVCGVPTIVEWQAALRPQYRAKIEACHNSLLPHAAALRSYDEVTAFHAASNHFIAVLADAQSRQNSTDPQATAKVWHQAGDAVQSQTVPPSLRQAKEKLAAAITEIERQWVYAAESNTYTAIPPAYDQLANVQLAARAAQHATTTTFNSRISELPHK